MARKTDARGAHFGAESPFELLAQTCLCAVVGLSPLSSRGRDHSHTLREEQLTISLYRHSTRVSTKVTVLVTGLDTGLSVLVLPPCPDHRDTLFSQSKRKYGPACICPVLARGENLFIWVTSRPRAAASRWVLQRGAAARACALREDESRGRFQASPFLAPVGNCISHAWMHVFFQLGNWEVTCLSSVQELQSRSQEVSKETHFITWTAVF